VQLLTHSVCLGQPCAKLSVYVAWLGESEGVHMITRRNGLYAAEAGVLGPSGQYNMTVEPIRSRCDLRKGHAHLKCNPSLLWNDAHRAESANRGSYLIEKGSNFRPLAFEMMLQIMPGAGVRLVAICEIAPALLTLPKRPMFHVGCIKVFLSSFASKPSNAVRDRSQG
jgi:hypothetical protein